MKTTRTIVVIVGDATGDSQSYLAANPLDAYTARELAIKFAAVKFPGLNYWYRSVNHDGGSRIAVVHCTKKGT